MNWIVFGVQWLHVLLGIIWFGNALVVAVILIPSLNPLPIPTQREVGSRYGERATRLLGQDRDQRGGADHERGPTQP